MVQRTTSSAILALPVILLLLASPMLAASRSHQPTPGSPTPTPTPIPTAQASPASGEVEVLKAQLAVQREYTDRLLDTVRWTLGIAVTIVVFSAGAGWYANFRLSERDRESIRTALEARVDTRIGEHTDTTRALLAQSATSLEKSTAAQIEQVRSHVESAAREAAENFREDLAQLRHDVLRLKYEAMILEARYWRDRGVHDNELLVYLRMVPLAQAIAWEYMISSALEGMEAALRAGASPDADRTREITAILAALPAEYAIVADRVRAQLSRERP